MSRRKIVSTIAALDQATKKGEELASSLSGDLDRIAHGAATSSSQKLFGVIGAAVGATSAISLAIVSSASLALMAPVFMALGGAVGVLFWRGGRGLRFEKEMHYKAALLETIKIQIEGLPSDAPEFVKDGLWSEYRAIVQDYGTTSLGKLIPERTIRVLSSGE
jgi:hypothetical protein